MINQGAGSGTSARWSALSARIALGRGRRAGTVLHCANGIPKYPSLERWSGHSTNSQSLGHARHTADASAEMHSTPNEHERSLPYLMVGMHCATTLHRPSTRPAMTDFGVSDSQIASPVGHALSCLPVSSGREAAGANNEGSAYGTEPAGSGRAALTVAPGPQIGFWPAIKVPTTEGHHICLRAAAAPSASYARRHFFIAGQRTRRAAAIRGVPVTSPAPYLPPTAQRSVNSKQCAL